jgi:hypothetical protein
MVGVVAVVEELLPQELRIAGATISTTNQTKRSQRTLALSKRKFGSSTTRPPSARSDFPEEFVIALCNFAGQRQFAADTFTRSPERRSRPTARSFRR